MTDEEMRRHEAICRYAMMSAIMAVGSPESSITAIIAEIRRLRAELAAERTARQELREVDRRRIREAARECEGYCRGVYRNISREAVESVGKAALKYLAEHPADDDTPIDEAWLLAVGWKFRTDRSGEKALRLRLPQHMGDDQWIEWDWRTPSLWRLPADVDCTIPAWVGLPQITTRGQLRRLCSALGIELKEST